jgi:ElaB/YqjD/DUF883 family membrane-anchored ribosome-binding protein
MASEPEMMELRQEIDQLRAGLDAALEKMRRLNGGELPNGHDTFATAEKMWTELKRQAQQVSQEIEEKPLVSAVTAFSIGMTIGMLLRGRRA